jgi:hypothetical protein
MSSARPGGPSAARVSRCHNPFHQPRPPRSPWLSWTARRPGRADQLSDRRLTTWLTSVGCTGTVDPAVLHVRLTAAPRRATGNPATTHAANTTALVAVLRVSNAQIRVLAAGIGTPRRHPGRHSDARILTSLPRPGSIRAARLLAAFGDARDRSPPATVRPARQGSAPPPHGRARSRPWPPLGADNQLASLCDFARGSRHANPGPRTLGRRALGRRALGRRALGRRALGRRALGSGPRPSPKAQTTSSRPHPWPALGLMSSGAANSGRCRPGPGNARRLTTSQPKINRGRPVVGWCLG